MKTLLVWMLVAAGAAGAAGAAEVYRCGADGREYRDQPCAGARIVDAADARSAAQVQAARQVAALERRLADQAAAERHEAERLQARLPGGLRLGASSVAPVKASQATAPHDSRRAHPHRKAGRLPGSGDEAFRAVAPASRRARS
ncbi:MAG: hypothetical protein AMXMBFR66_03620 [Pseudomonadota bacterium]|nr:hypothetical protein [Rubrivivax sp.]